MTRASEYECEQEEFLFFHTNEKSEKACMIVELVIKRELNGQVSLGSAGYACCTIFK